jgi:hypothetical protein
MNNLLYANQQAEKIGPQVEEKVRKETGSTSPVAYTIESGEAGSTTVGLVLGDVARGLFGGKTNTLFTLVFDIATPRAAQLRATVIRQGVGAYIGSLLYSTQLSKTVKSEVSLEPPKTFGLSKFIGDADTITKLNAKGDIAKRIGKFARTKTEMGSITVEMARLFKIVPQDSGSLLIVNTLPRMTAMGMDAAIDAKEFFEIAAMIEAAL